MSMGGMLVHRHQGQEEAVMEVLVVFAAVEVVGVADMVERDDLQGRLSMAAVLSVLCMMGGASGEDIGSKWLDD